MASAGACALAGVASGCDQRETAGAPVKVAPVTPRTIAPQHKPVDEDTAQDFLAEFFASDDGAGSTTMAATLADAERNAAQLSVIYDLIARARSGQLAASPVSDVQSVDLAHLVVSSDLGAEAKATARPFRLTGDVLTSLMQANGYWDAIAGESRIVFGLRGCVFADPETSSASGRAIALLESDVDYLTRRCVIGVWRPLTGDISLFAGSTTPSLVHMQAHLAWRFRLDAVLTEAFRHAPPMCGLMPQGLHWMRGGTHLAVSTVVQRRQPAALVQASATPVMRAHTALGYGLAEPWDPIDWRIDTRASDMIAPWVGAGIHGGVELGAPAFASAICQTLGAWDEFQAVLGLDVVGEGAAMRSRDEATLYPYMLTTGREARLHSEIGGRDDMRKSLRRLRIGSTGLRVVELKKLVQATTPGAVFDADTMIRLLRWQARRPGVIRDGAVTPKLAREAELTLWR